ncbi:MAG: Motility protein A [Holosporales bacterium]
MYFGGLIFSLICVIGGYIMVGGHMSVLWQPAEYIVILGSAIGAFLGSNRKHTLGEIVAHIGYAVTDKCKGKKEYTELLCAMYSIFKLARTKSMVAVEPHIENPKDSDIFKKYPSFLQNKHALHLFCDYIRMISMGVEDVMIIDDLMREEIDNIKHEFSEYGAHVQTLADSLPALGIVAAVLGVIHTMGSVDQPPAILGGLIGGALVGTFLGILVSYSMIAPIANRMKQTIAIENKYYDCVKAGIIAYLNNLPPLIAAETARKSIDPEFRPPYGEMEEKLNSLTDV